MTMATEYGTTCWRCGEGGADSSDEGGAIHPECGRDRIDVHYESD